jgi:predicted nucleic-acid-binding protein
MKGLDTNVLVRYLVRDDPEQSRIAARYIEAGVCYINAIVLCELVWVLESAYRYPRNIVASTMEKILMTGDFEIEDRDTAWQALADYRGTKADFADCLIVRRNTVAGCEETGTFDKRVKGIRDFRLL